MGSASTDTGLESHAFLERPALLLGLAFIFSCGQSNDSGALADQVNLQSDLSSQYQPAMGVGVNFSETKSYRRCITNNLPTNDRAFENQTYRQTMISSREQLNEAMGISASVSAKGMWGNGSVSGSFDNSIAIQSDSFYWLVYADYRLRNISIDTGAENFSLTEDAKRILAGPGGLESFSKACGTHFYSGYERGGRYALLYEVETHSEESREQIKAKAGYSGWGIQASAEFNKFMAAASESKSLKIHTLIEGGNDSLASYALDASSLEGELGKLKNALFEHDQGITTKWFISDYEIFPEIQEIIARDSHPKELIIIHQEEMLTTLYRKYVRAVELKGVLEQSLSKSMGPEPLFFFSPEKLIELNVGIKEIESHLFEISSLGRKCFQDVEQCSSTTETSLSDITIPTPDKSFDSLGHWDLIPNLLQQSKIYIEFSGKPHTNERYKRRRFDLNHSLFLSGEDVYAQDTHLHPENAYYLGRSRLVRDPITGIERPDICVYQTSNRCSLRMIDLAPIMGDNHPLVKLQLIVYDSYGFPVGEKLTFPVTE